MSKEQINMKNFFLKSMFSLFAAAWMSITLAAAENTQNPPAPDINALKIRAKQEWQNRKYPQARNTFREILKTDSRNAAGLAAEITVGTPGGTVFEKIDFYRCKADIAAQAKDNAMRDQAFADAIKLPGLNKVQLATAYLLPLENYGNLVSMSIADVEKICRAALKAAGDDLEARSRIWEKFATRVQHHNYYTPISPDAPELLDEALKQDLTPRTRFNIINQYRTVLLLLGHHKKALLLCETEAEKLADKDKQLAAYLFISAGNILSQPARYMNNIPDERDYFNAMLYYRRAIEMKEDMPAAYEAIVELSTKTHHMESALTAYGKLSLNKSVGANTKNAMTLKLARAYFEMEDFANTRTWLKLSDPEKLLPRQKADHYDLTMRLACMDGDYQKAADTLTMIEKHQNVYRYRFNVKEYRKRLNAILNSNQ